MYLFNLLFAAVSLAQNNLRLYLANIAQYLILCVLYSWMIYSERTDEVHIWLATALFLGVVFVARMLLQVSSRLGQVGRYLLAARFALVGFFLSWNVLSLLQYRFFRNLATVSSGRFEDAFRSLSEVLDRIRSPAVRSVAVSKVIVLLVLGRRWREVVEVHRQYASDSLELPAGILLHLIRAYSELELSDEAMECQLRMESCEDARESGLLMGRIFLFALSGDIERLRSTFARADREEWPDCFWPYWEGRCLLVAGQQDEGLETLARALEKAKDEPSWRQVIQSILEGGIQESAREETRRSPYFERSALELDRQEGCAWGLPEVRDLRWTRPGRATMAIIFFNVLGYMMITLGGGSEEFLVLVRSGALVPSLVDIGEWWRLATSMFLHIGLVHLLLNMFGLHMVGNFVENLYGVRRYLLIYFGAGLIASVLSYAMGDYSLSAGASGAICGLLGAVLAFGWKFQAELPPQLRKTLLFNFSLMVGILVLMAFFIDGIDHAAHLGGVFGGLVITLPLATECFQKGKSRLETVGSTVGAALVMSCVGVGLILGAVERSRGGYPLGTISKTVLVAGRDVAIEIPSVCDDFVPGDRKELDANRLVADMFRALGGGRVDWVAFREPWPAEYWWGGVGFLAKSFSPEVKQLLQNQWVERIQSLIRQIPGLEVGPTSPEEMHVFDPEADRVGFSYQLLVPRGEGEPEFRWDRRVVLYFREFDGGIYLFWFDLPSASIRDYQLVMEKIVGGIHKNP